MSFIIWLHYETWFSLSFGLSRLGVATADNLQFYDMAFVLRSEPLPATNPLFGGKNWATCLPHKVLLLFEISTAPLCHQPFCTIE